MRLALIALACLAVAPAAAQFAPPVVVADPGDGGIRVSEDGLLGNYFPGEGAGKRPAILLIGGSEGGLAPGNARMARALAEAGFATFQISYFRAPGQNPRLQEVPLETFDRALAWLRARPEVDGARLGVIGGSKGGEAALLYASRRPALRAVVAGMPSNVVWPGVDWEAMGPPTWSSWAERGKPFAFVPYPTGGFSFTGKFVDFYKAGLKALPEHPDAVIPVEKAKAALLLVCGEDDTLWPSCPMARDVAARAQAKKGPPVTLLAYRDAGHAVLGLPVPKDDPRYPSLATLGGTPDGNAAARADAWPKVVAFFTERLKP
jgi:uncharacterized protein